MDQEEKRGGLEVSSRSVLESEDEPAETGGVPENEQRNPDCVVPWKSVQGRGPSPL